MKEYRYDYHTKKMFMEVEIDFSKIFTESEQKILFLRLHGYTLNGIANIFDVTPERIRQILVKIEKKLNLNYTCIESNNKEAK